jgi:uncharacterized protein (TIGR02099 family)
VEAIDATVAFRGASMEIESTAGRILGIDVGRTRASIPVIGNRDEHLIVHGEAAGSLADFLRFVSSSPVADYTDRLTGKMRAQGVGKLRIDFDLPLNRTADAKVAGTLDVAAAEFQVDPRAPTLTEAQALIEFSESSVAIRDGRAALYGAPMKFSAARQKEGGILVSLGGRFDAQGWQRSHDSAIARRIEGTTSWKGALAIRKGVRTLTVESSLVGMALRMPPPLAKSANAQLPLKFELVDRPGAEEQASLVLGDLATARFALERGAISRGEFRFGGLAELPARAGLRLAGGVGSVDVDAWRQWSTPEVAKAGPPLTAVDLSAARLTLSGREFHSVRLRGESVAGGWQLSLEANEAAGSLAWQDGAPGRLSARFTTLVIPEPQSELRPADVTRPSGGNLPALEMVAENFTYEGKNLGRLELLASPSADNWRLDRLSVVNPDGRVEVTGKWLLTEPPSTELDLRIEASDAGRLLGRFGYTEGIVGGKGSLAGPVQWVGAPYRVDMATLGGQLRLEASAGRFAKLEPGVGKLLGILSLQAIPRRLSLDFRDIFRSGFSFDQISADVTVGSGVARTENFRMEGSAARVQMSGQIDLPAETQELKIRVFPQLSTGVAIAGAAVINPAVGVAALVAQKALGDPVERMAALEYHVSGTWAEPRVEPVTPKTETPSARK